MTLPVEAALVKNGAALPLASLGTLATLSIAKLLRLEWLLSTPSRPPLPVEWRANFAMTSTLPIEALGSAASRLSLPLDWRAPLRCFGPADRVAPSWPMTRPYRWTGGHR